MMKQLFFVLNAVILLQVSMAGAQTTPPYVNSFDSAGDTIGWSHYATVGTDDWQMGDPNGQYLNYPHTQPNGWMTDLGPTYAINSAKMACGKCVTLNPVLSTALKRAMGWRSLHRIPPASLVRQ